MPRSPGAITPNTSIGRGVGSTINAPISINVEGGLRDEKADAEIRKRIGADVDRAVP